MATTSFGCDEKDCANTSKSFVNDTTTTAGMMTNISLTPRASLESTSPITAPSQQPSEGDSDTSGKQQYHSNPHHHHQHDPHSPPCSPPPGRSSDSEHQTLSSISSPYDHQQAQPREDEQQIPKDGQDPEPQHNHHHHHHHHHQQQQHKPSPSTSSSIDTKTNTTKNTSRTVLNEFITRSRSSTLYTPSDNERDEQIRIAILMRCLDMEDRFRVQAARYWNRLEQ